MYVTSKGISQTLLISSLVPCRWFLLYNLISVVYFSSYCSHKEKKTNYLYLFYHNVTFSFLLNKCSQFVNCGDAYARNTNFIIGSSAYWYIFSVSVPPSITNFRAYFCKFYYFEFYVIYQLDPLPLSIILFLSIYSLFLI